MGFLYTIAGAILVYLAYLLMESWDKRHKKTPPQKPQEHP